MKYGGENFRHVWPARTKRVLRRQARKQERRAGRHQSEQELNMR